MDTVLFAILVAIIILALFTIESRESLTAEECGTTGRISLPFDSLSRFDHYSRKSSGGWNATTLEVASGTPTTLARRCDEIPGCVAFDTSGYLMSGILPRESWQNSGLDLYVRKCAQSEPLYVELYVDRNFGTTTSVGRVLVPPGRYPDLNNIAGAPGVIGGKMPRNAVSSVKIPIGLRLVMFNKIDFAGWKQIIGHGDYPDLRVFKTGNLFYPTWNDEVKSILVEYDPTV